MTAFDRAWDLAKTPLVPGSIRYDGPHVLFSEDLLNEPPHNYSAEFQSPTSDRIMPMEGRYYPPNDDDDAYIRVKLEDKKLGGAGSANASPISATSDSTDYELGWRGHIEAYPNRRGMGTALYDMIAAILEHREGDKKWASLLPNTGQSEPARALWRGKESGWPVPDEPIR